MDSGAWWATIHAVTKSQTQFSGYTMKQILELLTLARLFLSVEATERF